jgi:hypothetical protein
MIDLFPIKNNNTNNNNNNWSLIVHPPYSWTALTVNRIWQIFMFPVSHFLGCYQGLCARLLVRSSEALRSCAPSVRVK